MTNEIEALLIWDEMPQFGTEPYVECRLSEIGRSISATYVAANFYGGAHLPYPAFERDGKVAYISDEIEAQILALLDDRSPMDDYYAAYFPSRDD